MEKDPPHQRLWKWMGGFALTLAASPLGAAPVGTESLPSGQGMEAAIPWTRSTLFILALLVINGLMAMAETSLLSMRKTRLSQLVEEGNRAAPLAQKLLEDPGRLLTTLRIGTILTGFAIAVIAVETFGNALRLYLRSLTGLASSSLSGLVIGAITLAAALIMIVLIEVALKSMALQHPERVSLFVSRPAFWLCWLLSPLVSLALAVGSLLLRPSGMTVKTPIPLLTEEELKMIVEAGEEEGVLEEEEKAMIHSIFEFTDTVVRKVMTPRIDIACVEVTDTLDEVVQAILREGHTRIPVYEVSIDNIIGIIHAKDLLRLLDDWNGSHTLQDVITEQKEKGISILREPYFIPENKRADELLAEFRQSKNQLAIVIDEHGGTAGLVTVEDLVEEIVGDILDEYDVEEPMVEVEDENTSIIDARMPIDDFNEQMGLDLPEEEFDTVGGFVFGLFGKLPSEEDSVDYENLKITVLKADGHRIQKIRIMKQTPQPEEPAQTPVVQHPQ